VTGVIDVIDDIKPSLASCRIHLARIAGN
jgi:hypothetical protein